MPLDYLLDKARKFLVESLRDQPMPYRSRRPWQSHWKSLVLHSLRVEDNVLKILDRESHSLSAEKIQMIRLAAIMHDIAKPLGHKDHAKNGADIAREWLSNQNISKENISRVTKMIAAHGKKHKKELDYPTAVLKDADLLDKIGAISVVTSTNHLDRRSPFYLSKLSQRINQIDLPDVEAKMEKLRTAGAREIALQRLSFIANFSDQMINELSVDAAIEQQLYVL